jgi:hypothetical protein
VNSDVATVNMEVRRKSAESPNFHSIINVQRLHDTVCVGDGHCLCTLVMWTRWVKRWTRRVSMVSGMW